MSPEPAPDSSRDRERLAGGHYARKQIFCRSRVVAWSHGSRFDRARELVAPFAGGRLIDYGCGDGTFIAMVHGAFASVCGVDADAEQIEGCRTRLGDMPNVGFAHVTSLGPADEGAWTVVTCMEVLEHCLEDERRAIIARLARLVAPRGRVVISVPIETGPSLVGKQLVRAIAGMRGVGDYQHRERYSPIEMVRGLFGLPVPRAVYSTAAPGAGSYYGHKGFSWPDVQREVESCLSIEERSFSPMPWSGAALNSQVWFICRARAS